MTLSTTTVRATASGPGSTGTFAFKITAASDLVVYKTDADGVTSTLSYPTDYTVSGVGDAAGGTVTLATALVSGESIEMVRATPTTQSTAFRTLGTFRPESHEDALDRLTMIGQQQDDGIARAVRLHPRLDPSLYAMVLAPETGKVLAWDANGITNVALDSSAVALPGHDRLTATLSALLANNIRYNVLDYTDPDTYVHGTTDIGPAIQAAINAAPDRSVIEMPGFSTAYKLSTTPTLAARSGLFFDCRGASVQLSGTDVTALRFSSGMSTDITVFGLKVIGSNVLADNQQGLGTIVGAGAGIGGTNVRYLNCHFKDLVRGIHHETTTVVSRNFVVSGCTFENIIGTASGKGYACALASLVGATITDCYFDQVQRHSVYCSNTQDLTIKGNTFRRHRDSVATTAVVSACVVSRRPNVSVIGNHFDTCSDNALEISSDESVTNQPMYNVTVASNVFHASVYRDITVGSDAAATSSELSGVKIIGNTFNREEAASVGTESIRIYNGRRVTIAINDFRAENAYTLTKALIVVGSSGIAASFMNILRIAENTASITMNGFGGYLIEIASTIAQGTSQVNIVDNDLDLSGASGGLILYDATRTNPNIVVRGNNLDDPASGGYRQTIDGWTQNNVAASQTSVVMVRWTTTGTGFATQWLAIRPGSITGIGVKSNAARSAGTLTVTAHINGSATALAAVLDGTNTTSKSTTQARGVDNFVAGDVLDIRITTDGSWAPTTADITASLEVTT